MVAPLQVKFGMIGAFMARSSGWMTALAAAVAAPDYDLKQDN
jgi:hypothetical protein